MFNQYYQQELANLRELAVEFSKEHPALAPMLGGQTSDPDVERLLEGVAFLTGLLREKLDDELPEIIQGLMQLIFPHYLRPLPSATIIAFTPKPNLKQTYNLPAGAELASIQVQGTQCLFRTCYDIEAHPLTILEATFEQPPAKPPRITLLLELSGIDLSAWDIKSLRFHIAGDYPAAAKIYYLLRYHLGNIFLESSAGSESAMLGPDDLKPVGFTEKEAMIPYPSRSFSGYRILQEYFIMPEKFLFLDLTGWEKWRNRGGDSKFKIIFELKKLPFPPPKISRDNFVLFATPAINLFSHEAEPILLDHRQAEYRVDASGANRIHYQVYSVDEVVGFQRGVVQARKYQPFELFQASSPNTPTYNVSFKKSPVRESIDALLSFTYPAEAGVPVPETISVRLTCANGSLPENLRIGDISKPTSTSPELLEYKNIRTPTANVLPPLGKAMLWRFLSLYSLNYLPIAHKENLQALLNLYIFPESRDKVSVYANTRKVEGISDIHVESINEIVSGYIMRGQEVKLRLLADHFASEGDLFLFGCILDNFFGSYASINSFIKIVIEEILKEETYRWPARLGDRPLI